MLYLDHLNQEILLHTSQGLLDTAIFHNLPRNILSDLLSN